MRVEVENEYDYYHQLHRRPDAGGVPLWSEVVTADLGELIDETFTVGVLAEQFPRDPHAIRVRIRPLYSQEPVVEQVRVELVAGENGGQATYSREYSAGRWVRSAQRKALELRREGTLAQDATAYRLLMALKRDTPSLTPPLVQGPSIEEATLASCGVRRLGEGAPDPDRPVLVNARFAADAVRRCEEAGTQETGGAVLGKMIRLPQALPATRTRVVTILSSLVEDQRHTGATAVFRFSPEGLAEAAQIADVRGLGESVVTVFHTHGWSRHCRRCRPSNSCPLAGCSPSLQDYEELSALFPSKGTLLPIAGRKPGVQGERPVLQIHAWRGGQLEPIAWQQYLD